MAQRQKMLDLRYNELWNDWADADEVQSKTEDIHDKIFLSWRHLNVSVKQIVQKFFKQSEISYKKILDNVSGNVRCGMLLGIMGSSGSGKTTLLATISHRMKGDFGGELIFNGRPISEEVMIKISGFVPQNDISFDQLTAFEHLSLMANLKMDRRTTKVDVKNRIDYVITTLGMGKFLNTRISFLSGGERKKVALAVQLLNDPAILFCDEITTGLDSYSAAHIVNTLKIFARTGKIVICTIHQPASGVYGKFDEVLLLSNGRLVYQGPVPMVRQLFEKFDYKCPHMFNEADFVISVLNSESEKVKRDIDEMCKLSAVGALTDIDYEIFHYKNEPDYTQHLQTKKQLWITQFILISNRSLKCFFRSYKTKLLELGTILFLGLISSFSVPNTSFDSRTVQNFEGFLFMFIINSFIRILYSTIPTYFIQFALIHREVHNGVYSLSAYYVSELIVMIVWTLIKMLLYSVTAFTIAGFEWGIMELFVFSMVAFTALSFGILMSSWCNKMEYAFVFSSFYDCLSSYISGAYLSIKSLPKLIYSLRFISLYFLGCEVTSTLFWKKIPHLPCVDVNNCLSSGDAVLDKYGYISDNFNSDIIIMISFCILANACGYFGILKKMRKQPAY